MSKKISVHFGINKFDPKYYGSGHDLSGCVNDSSTMAHIASESSFKSTIYTNEICTKAKLIERLTSAANELQVGDTFLFSQSSHGTYQQIGKERHTGLCMYDQIIWDSEFKSLLAKFKKGVLVVLFADACFSEDNFKWIQTPDGKTKFFDSTNLLKKGSTTVHYEKSKDIVCNVISYSSSNMYQPSYDMGVEGGLFTVCIKKIWGIIKNLNYYKTYLEIQKEMASTGYPQTPIFSVVNGNEEATTYKTFLK